MRVSVVLAVAGLPLAESVDLARRAEAAGCDTVAAGEATYDSFAVTAALAQATTGARVMTTVTTWTRPPVLAATGALTLAELSGARFALSLGTMPAAWNRDHYGIDPSHAAARMREYIDCVRGAYAATADEPFTYEGRFFRIQGFGRSWPPPPRPPLAVHLAATRPAMASLAGQVADGVLYNVIHTRRWLQDVLGPAVAAGERSRTARVERGVMVRVVPHRTGGRERALEQARVAVAPYVGVPYLADVLGHHGWRPEAATSSALEELVVLGAVDQVVQRLLEYRNLVDWLLLAPPRMLPAADLHSWYQTVLDELTPALSSAPAGAQL